MSSFYINNRKERFFSFDDKICDGETGQELSQDEIILLLNEGEESKQKAKELQDNINQICDDYEYYHGMDIRNANWFSAW